MWVLDPYYPLLSLREALEISQVRLADNAGKTQSSVSQSENAEDQITLVTLLNYAEACGCELRLVLVRK